MSGMQTAIQTVLLHAQALNEIANNLPSTLPTTAPATGSVTLPAGPSSYIVTNANCTATSKVFTQARSSEAAAIASQVYIDVISSGSFSFSLPSANAGTATYDYIIV